jgi:MFS family permease
MSDPVPVARREAAVIALVSGAHSFSHFYIFALPTILAFMVKDPSLAHLELTFAKAGLVVSAFSISSGIFQYFMGSLADRIGARPVLFGGLFLISGAFGLIGFSTSYPMMLALAFIAGIGNSVFHPVDFSILNGNIGAPRIARAYAIHTFSGYTGFAAGPFVAGLLVVNLNWQSAFWICGAAGVTMAAFLFTQRHRMAGEAPPKPSTSAPAAAKAGFSVVLTAPLLMMFVFYTLSGGLSIGLNSAVAAALNKLWAIPLEQAAWAVSTFMIGGAAGTLVGGTVAARAKRLDTVALAGYAVSGTMLWLVATVGLPYLVILAAFCLGGFMFGVITPSRDVMVKSLTPPGHSGKVFGFVSSGFEVGGIALAPVFGALIDHNAPAWVFYMAVIIMALAFAAAMLATRLRRPAPQTAAAAE